MRGSSYPVISHETLSDAKTFILDWHPAIKQGGIIQEPWATGLKPIFSEIEYNEGGALARLIMLRLNRYGKYLTPAERVMTKQTYGLMCESFGTCPNCAEVVLNKALDAERYVEVYAKF